MQMKLISLSIVEHEDSLRNRDKQQLGNGLLHEPIGQLQVIIITFYYMASNSQAN